MKVVKLTAKINKELKMFHFNPRIDRKHVKRVLAIVTNEKNPKNWVSVKEEVISKVGFEEHQIEIPSAWLYSPKKEKKEKKTFKLSDFLPSS